MRDIKFRCWDESTKQMTFPDALFLCGGKWYNSVELPWAPNVHATGVNLMQYTGIKDKNGKEIYEGDLVSHMDGKMYEIFWHEGTYIGWYMKRTEKIGTIIYGLYNHGQKQWAEEVIGNIYETPELIGEGK